MLFLFFLFLLFTAAQASTPPGEPVLNANEILLPVGTAGKWISLMEISTIRMKEVESINGKKLSFFEKIGFRLSQRKLRNAINNDGTVTKKALHKYAGKLAEGGSDFHAGGFFLGLLLNIWAIPIVLLMRNENRNRRIKWTLIGLGTILALVLLVFLAMAGGRFR